MQSIDKCKYTYNMTYEKRHTGLNSEATNFMINCYRTSHLIIDVYHIL